MDDLLEQWPDSEPPAGFADRVLAARRKPRRYFALGALAACAAAGAFLLLRGSGVSRGSLEAGERASVSFGNRGVAVAEAGSSLRWSVDRKGAARVAQSSGDVFYRVEPGGPFQVTAPGADIFVTGTCFRVEVVPMVKPLVSAAAGAAVASAVLVTVYEGKVRVAGPAGALDVAAGEQARAEPGAAPRLVVRGTSPELLAPPAQTDYTQESRDQLVSRSKQDHAQIASLQGRVRELESERGKLASLIRSRDTGSPSAEERPGGLPPRDKFRDFTPSELKAMADQCEVRMDVPPLDREPWQMSPQRGAAMHLSDDEQARVAAAVNQVRLDALAKLRALYVEVTGDSAGADSLETFNLGREILHKSQPKEVEAARARVAREKAGLEQPPPDPNTGNAPERYFRLMSSLGDTLQRGLEPAFGQQQAGKLRDSLTPSKMVMNGCDDSGR